MWCSAVAPYASRAVAAAASVLAARAMASTVTASSWHTSSRVQTGTGSHSDRVSAWILALISAVNDALLTQHSRAPPYIRV